MPATETQPDATAADWIAITSVILCTFLISIDSGIAGSTIREVQGSLGSGVEEGSWISTAYLLGEMISIPVAVYFATIFSPRNFLLFCTTMFVFISIYCGMSTSLEHMLAARFLQGLTGGTLRPMGHYLIIMLIPTRQRQFPFFLSIFFTSLAPAIGAAIGGFVATNYTWTACFYVQAIPGMFMVLLLYLFLKPTPMNLKELWRVDWMMMFALSIGLCLMTYILQEGNRLDWFNDPDLPNLTIACVGFLALASVLFYYSKNPFIQLKVLFHRNFLAANTASALVRVAMYANVLLMTLFLTRVQGYNSEQCGEVAIWFGIPQIIIFPFVLYIVRHFDTRWVVVAGNFIFLIACLMNSRIDHTVSYDFFWWSQVVAAIGQPLLLTPLTGIAYMGIEAKDAASASALYNMIRAIGGAMAVAFMGVLINDRQRFHFSRIVETLNHGNLYVGAQLDKYNRLFADHGMDGSKQALLKMKRLVDREAFTMAYADTYWLVSGVLLLTIFAVLMARKARKPRVNVKPEHGGTALIEGHRFPLTDLSSGGFGIRVRPELLAYFSEGTSYGKIVLEFANVRYLVDAEVASASPWKAGDGAEAVKAGFRFVNLPGDTEQALSRETDRRAPKPVPQSG